MSRRVTAPEVVAVRGAIQVSADRAPAIRDATARLLTRLVESNRIAREDVISAFFTATPDLSADFPAHAARMLGWRDVPLLGAVEMGVPGAPPRLVRILLLVRGKSARGKLQPVYMDGAEQLRPDLFPAATAASKRSATAKLARIAIIGLGQIGGSIGLALGRAGGYERIGFDRVARVRAAARAAGAVDRVAPTLAAACRNVAIAIVAVPVDVLPRTIDAVAAALPRGAVLLDTGSARRGITEALDRAAKRGVRAVGGHPIAGNEGRGLAAARAELFDAATFALLPVRGRAVPPAARNLVRALGAKPLVIDASSHDRALASTSHLPYLISKAIEESGRMSAKRGLAGPGFASMTRLAKSDPRVAGAYVSANAAEVARAWNELKARTEREVKALRTRRR